MKKTPVTQQAKTTSGFPPTPGILQRKCACGTHMMGGGECADCTKKKSTLQRKLVIGASNDLLEQEADRIADQVMAGPVPSHVNLVPPRIQRFTGHTAGQMGGAPASVEHILACSGRPLAPAIQDEMGQRFGYDFSQVRVHSGTDAAQSAREVSAQAYTVGRNIVFGADRFSPATHEGRWLLAHELTHVVQQNAVSQAGLQRSVDTDASPSGGEYSEGKIGGKLTSKVPAPLSPRMNSSAAKDPNCPDYDPGEKSVSHREPGHLEPDVERIASDKLLVADFGVDWRHIKSSTKSDSTLTAWLTAWESDDSYRLSIIGYSDCVGAEGLNTDLRQARASNVEALLGPGAKSRTTFRGMAALGNYVTDNSTATNRARNRGVIIKFHQEFDFPEEEIVVTPQYCGPDSTQWLVDQMNQNRDHPVIKTQREVEWPNWIPIFNLGWNYGALSDFRDLVKAGAPWDFKSNQSQWRSGRGNTCPTTQCDKTVFLCGKCFFYDVPGNIHYGYIGRMASIRAWFLHNRASAAQKGGVDPSDDTAAINIGIAMADEGATLCGEIAAHENELSTTGTKGCGRCPKTS